MRIAMVVTAFPAVSETFILHQITGLLDLGHDVRIVSLRRPEDQPVHGEVEEYDLLSRTRYVEMPQSRLAMLGRAVPALFGLFRRHGWNALDAISLMHRRFGLPHPRDLAVTEDIVQSIKQCDIVHCHFGMTGLDVLPGSALARTPLVVTFHGIDASAYIQQMGRDCYSRLFDRGDGFMAVSEYIRQRLLDAGCPAEKLVVHYISSRLRDIDFRVRRRASGQPTEILTIGRLVEKKGLEYSIRAVVELLDRGYSVRYRIAGEGALRQKLEDQIAACDATGQIALLGQCDRRQVCDLLNEAHIFCLSSVMASDGDTEGMPVVLREAQAAGLPTVTTDHAGNPEALLDGESGFVVPERDGDALAERLAYLIDNPETWPEMGRKGRAFVEDHFDVRKLNRRLVSIYEDVIAGRSPRQGDEPQHAATEEA